MPPGPSVLAFAVASAILIVIPGPSVLFTVGRALAYGRRTALATVCGNAAGNYLVAACVAVGVGAVIQRSAPVFLAIRLAGALYLIWLGVQAFRKRGHLADAFAVAVPARRDRRAVREGFLVGVTNPKAPILFAAGRPEFVGRAAGAGPGHILRLALISIAIGLVADSTWALAAGGLWTWIARSPR